MTNPPGIFRSPRLNPPRPAAPSAAIAAVIPAHNESEHIGPVLAVLRQVEELAEIIVVDDGSTDDTCAEVHAASDLDPRLRCVRLPVNLGKGAALFAGARAADAKILLFLDADLSGLRPEHVRALIQPVRAGQADMTLGLFRGGHFNTDFAHWATPWLTGQRCLRAELFFRVNEQNASGYGIETAISLTARRSGGCVQRVPLRGVSHPSSEFHHGPWHGLWVRAKMYGEILKTLYAERAWRLLRPCPSARKRVSLRR